MTVSVPAQTKMYPGTEVPQITHLCEERSSGKALQLPREGIPN